MRTIQYSPGLALRCKLRVDFFFLRLGVFLCSGTPAPDLRFEDFVVAGVPLTGAAEVPLGSVSASHRVNARASYLVPASAVVSIVVSPTRVVSSVGSASGAGVEEVSGLEATEENAC